MAGVSISAVTQDALRAILGAVDTERWLDRLEQLPRSNVAHESVIAALDDAREDFGA
jgi:post-segregation antitoxin (ccd killing protein)